MPLLLSQRIALSPNNKQVSYFKQACGIARLAFNWGLAEWNAQYRADKAYREQCILSNSEVDKTLLKRPNGRRLDKQFNAIKKATYPFVSDVSSCITQIAFQHLNDGFQRFFKKQNSRPTFKKKGKHYAFHLANNKFYIKGDQVYIPKLGLVKLAEPYRYANQGRILKGLVSQQGRRWFLSVTVERDEPMKTLLPSIKATGFDLGLTDFIVTSEGQRFTAPKPLKHLLRQLKKLNRSLSRKVRFSRNWQKAKAKLNRLHYKIACQRKDFLHKLTNTLIKRYGIICMEDLNVKGLLKNRRLSRAIADVGFGLFRSILEYKVKWYQRELRYVDRFFPSSKRCSVCGTKRETLPLSVRAWICEHCHTHHDRDINAARNILQIGQGLPD